MVSGHDINWLINMKQMVIRMLEKGSLEMSLQLISINIIGEDCLHGYKIMKIHSQNLLYLVKHLGMMIILRKDDWFRMLNILVWLIQFLKH
jgi:hypothetical protein